MNTLLYTSQFGYELAPAKQGDVGMDLPCIINGDVFIRTEQNIPRLVIHGITEKDIMISSGLINEELTRIVIPPGVAATIPSGINTKIPDGTWMMITARSSTVFRKSLLVFPGVVDEGYLGELLTRVYNPTEVPQYISNGDSLSQAIIIPKPAIRTELTDKLPSTERGMTGFGSSGR